VNLDPGGGGIDSIGDVARQAGNRQSDPPLEQPDDLVGLEVENGVRVEVQGAAVRKEHLGTASLRPQPIPGEERHRRGLGIGFTVPLQHNRTLDERDMRGGLGTGRLLSSQRESTGANRRHHHQR